MRIRANRSAHPRRNRRRVPGFDMLESRALLTSYYVSTSGNDSNPGTLNQPFRTIQKGLDSAAHPGDSVIVRGGVYTGNVTFSHSGNASGYITLSSYPGETAILDGSSGGAYMIQVPDNVSYIKIVGLELRNFNCNVSTTGGSERDRSAAIVIRDGCSYIDILDNTIDNTYGTHAQAISARSYSASAPITHLLIDGNRLYDINEGDGEAVSIGGAVDGWQFSNNDVSTWGGNIALDPQGGPNSSIPVDAQPRDGLVSNNDFHDTTSGAAIYIDGAELTTVESNIFKNVSVAMSVTVEHPTMTAQYNIFQNNIAINSKNAFYSYEYPDTSGRVYDNEFLNNIIYGSDGSGSDAISLEGQFNVVVQGNIIDNAGGIYLSNCPNAQVDDNQIKNT